jgi:hypothetical protein
MAYIDPIFNQTLQKLSMKRHFKSLIFGLVISSFPLITNAQVSLSVGNGEVSLSAGIQINSPNDFYEPLGSLGAWVDIGPYGRCWHPSGVSSDWQPYVDGQWVWTDAGWYWQSDEPWGWATCHYGSWVNNPSYGWCWIPGTEWAPAWVTWRESDDYVGWAPCGPNRSVLGPEFFVFTGTHDFGRQFHSRRDFVVNDRNIINRTHVRNEFSTRNVNIGGHERRISVNQGPAMESIQRATGRTYQARPVQDVARERQPANLHQNGQQEPGRDRNGVGQEQRNRNNEQPRGTENQQGRAPRNEQQPAPGIEQQRTPRNEQQPGVPQTSQPAPNRNERPGQHPVTPQERQIQPTGQEHGVSVPPQQHEVPHPAVPSQSERPTPKSVTTHEGQVSPTGQEHGISQPPQPREVPPPAQPAQPGRSERPTPSAAPQERPVPPTGQEHGISQPPQQREVPHPAQPATPSPSERPTPRATPHEGQVPPTGQEHGVSHPPQQNEATRAPEARPQTPQPAEKEKAPQPQQRQDGKDQRNP